MRSTVGISAVHGGEDVNPYCHGSSASSGRVVELKPDGPWVAAQVAGLTLSDHPGVRLKWKAV